MPASCTVLHHLPKDLGPLTGGENPPCLAPGEDSDKHPAVGVCVPWGPLSPPGRGHPSALSGSAHMYSQSSTASSAASCVLR